ncbi:HEPN domain-containing protein [Bacillus cereus]|uniref:HEPN domain-containing protein n=1 Tax=Bacillus cereus TaxID=1396 RepID=UPI0002EDF5C6|nr:HEPN domain-containing protein [Bacillus cereus]KMP50164.1 hypothetical protein TU59_23325 [Bacillus cereus]
MQYKFVAPLYNLKITSELNRGKPITSNMRISNSKSNFLRNFDSDQVLNNFIGHLEYDNLQKNTYIVATGDYDQLYKYYEKHDIEKANHYYILNALMRRIQMFCNILWLIKDNSVHLQMGFIIVGTDTANPIGTSTGTAFSFLNSRGTFEDVSFTSGEIERAINFYKQLVADDFKIPEIGERIVPDIYNLKSTRVDRAFHFLQAARREDSVPVKIMNYCTVLECLFTRDNTELTHKIAERFAKIIGKEIGERIGYYNLIKRAYAIRSLVIHGQPISSKKLREVQEIAIELDNAIRILFNELFFNENVGRFFAQSDEELDKGFLNMILE